MRTIFFGTPAIAVPALRALAETTELVGVVCQPDRPKGRGLELGAPPVKLAAGELGVEVHQPVKVKTGNLDEWIRARVPDVALVIAYGRILPPAVLAAPRFGCMNLHASLLPKLRGAAPIQWALIGGETETGISLMQMDEGMDTGPVYSMRRIPIGAEETAGELATRLAELAAVVVREDLPGAVVGGHHAAPQDDALATLAPPLRSGDARLDWTGASSDLVNRVRGFEPDPGAHTTLRGKRLRVHQLRISAYPASAAPGTVVLADKGGVVIATGAGSVELVRAQLEGKRVVAARDLVNGRQLAAGDVLGGAG